MLKSIKSAILLGLSTIAVATPTMAHAQSAALRAWYGQFLWEESLGRIGGSTPSEGAAAFVSYTLTLGPDAGPSGCMLRGEGFQTNEQLKCTATPELGSVIIKYFALRPTGGRYYSGQPLFRMSRGEHGIVTRLQALEPQSDATARTGRLFRRIG